MKTCSRCKQVKPFSEFGKRARIRDGHESSCRPCKAERKRELRKINDGRPTEPPGSIYRVKIPAARLRPALTDWCERSTRPFADRNMGYVRRVYAILHEQQHVTFDAADKLLIELGLEHLWHEPPPMGLADIYEYGPAPVLGGHSEPHGLTRTDRAGGATDLEEAA